MDINKLAARLNRLQDRKGGSKKKNFFKAPDDGKTKANIRLIPYPHNDNNEPFMEIGWHYNVAGHRSLICPRETYGDPCPICELADQFKEMGGKDNWKIFKSLSAKLRYYSPIIVRNAEDEGVKLWGYGTTIYEDLLSKFMDPDWGDLSHPTTGRDLKVWTIPEGGVGNDTDYAKPKMDVSPNQTKLLDNKAKIAELLKSIPNYLEDGETFKALDHSALKDIVAKLADGGEEDSSDESWEDYDDNSEDNQDDTTTESGGSLDDDLADLLKDD